MYQIILKSGQIMFTDVRDFVNDVQKRMQSGEFGIATHEAGLTVDTSQVAAIFPFPTRLDS